MLLFSEVRADGLLFLLLIFSICSPVKSDNIDFGMDFFFLSHSLKHTHTHCNSQQCVSASSEPMCTCNETQYIHAAHPHAL